MKVKQFIQRKVPTIHQHESITEAIKQLTSIPESSLPVVDSKGRVIGELSQENLLLKIIGRDEMSQDGLNFQNIKLVLAEESTKVDELINRHELTASPDDDIKDIVKLMYDSDISTVPVIDAEDRLLGIVSDVGILHHYKELIGSDK